MSTQKCILNSCQAKVCAGRTLFSFPSDKDRRETWFRSILGDIPGAATTSNWLADKKICDQHFDPIMYSSASFQGSIRKRLFCNAVPTIKIIKFTPVIESPPPGPESLSWQLSGSEVDRLASVKARSKEVQANLCSRLTYKEIERLKQRIKQLENQIKRMKKNPSDKFIYNHRHKLAKYVKQEAWMLFDCACTNQPRGDTHSHRHNPYVKRLTLQIAQRNRMAFKIFKHFFNLPSLRTLGRLKDEMAAQAENATHSADHDPSMEDHLQIENVNMENFQSPNSSSSVDDLNTTDMEIIELDGDFFQQNNLKFPDLNPPTTNKQLTSQQGI